MAEWTIRETAVDEATLWLYAVSENVEIGHLQSSEHSPGTWMLENLQVCPDYRRQGIASSLVTAAFERVGEVDGWLLSLPADQRYAIPFYERQGFRFVPSHGPSRLMARGEPLLL
jgi:ribosomal protein S18 acetylase RimI-like enzyme